MIDLHSHILSGLDDGAGTLDISIEMARMAVVDGVTHMACTPHIVPARYPNSWATIQPAIRSLQSVLDVRAIPLKLVAGADVHAAWDLEARLAADEIPTLNRSRYFLLEPPHQFRPPWLEILARRLLDAGFVPIITHPERLEWASRRFDVVQRLSAMGCPLQLTADSLLGRFGSGAQALANQILDEGLTCIVASDAHGIRQRTPVLSLARQLVVLRLGAAVAENMFREIPRIILANGEIPRRKSATRHQRRRGRNRFQKLVGSLLGEH